MKKEDLEKEIPDTIDETVTGETPEDLEFEEVNDEGEVDARATIKKLREKIKRLEEEKKDYLDLSQRTRADYMNFKKEVDANRAVERKFATKGFIGELLPVLDAYDMAQANKDAWEKVDANWRMGIEYIFNQLKGILEKEGVIQYGNQGDAFDPELHESLETVPVDEEGKHDTIVRVLQNGYRMHDTVLRPARVHVGRYDK